MSNKVPSDFQTIIHPLQPLYNSQSEILILGSFPSVKTREYGFFYGHPQNRFWPMISAIFGEALSTEIEERRKFLLKHYIAVYDAIYQCDIIGSSDATIRNVIPSDLSKIFQEADIQQVFCNGSTAFKYYQKYHADTFGIEAIKLPSTSPANAACCLNRLIDSWQVIRDYISISGDSDQPTRRFNRVVY